MVDGIEFFRGAKAAFDELLAGFGFDLAVERYDYESFGSAYAEYSRRGLRLRLVWDGKEGGLLVEFAPGRRPDHKLWDASGLLTRTRRIPKMVPEWNHSGGRFHADPHHQAPP